MRLTMLLLVSVLLASCGAEQKSLFSSWSGKTSGFLLDLSGKDFGTHEIIWLIATGEQCQSTMAIGGTESSGSFVSISPFYVSGTGGGSDPGCSAFTFNGTYTKKDSILTICVTECEDYE